MEKQEYQILYEEFLKNYQSGTTTGENVGEIIAKLSQHFTEANLNHASALIEFNRVAKVIEERTDDNGKPISSSKAKIFSEATPESEKLIQATAHLENIEAHINSLKALQKGILNEYSHMSNI